jgi:ribosomal protein L40E
MVGASDPNIVIGELALGGLALGLSWRLLVWARESPKTPDPWDDEIQKKLNDPESVEICHRCFSEQPSDAWFCEHCGSAVGPYNNLMPYFYIFSQGEILRNGVTNKLRTSPFIIAGYLLFSLSAYTIFAPIYWFLFFKNLKRLKEERLNELSEDTE